MAPTGFLVERLALLKEDSIRHEEHIPCVTATPEQTLRNSNSIKPP
jgi:hypothetical protein